MIENDHLKVIFEPNINNTMMINVTVLDKSNNEFNDSFIADMTIFNGEKTKSCYYLFNPYTNASYVD